MNAVNFIPTTSIRTALLRTEEREYSTILRIAEVFENHSHDTMVTASIQDRTSEFRAVLAQAQKRQKATKGAQRQSLLTEAQRKAASGTPNGEIKGGKKGARSEFARRAAEIGRGISGTMEKLERLAQRRSSLR